MKKSIKLSLAASVLAVSNLYAQDNYDMGVITVSSATKSEQSIKDVTSNVEVITSAELEEKHCTTVTEALNSITGISVTSQGGLGSTANVNIRGMESKRVLVLVDGVRYNDPTNTIYGSSFNHLMVNDIEKIEVIKGAQSGVWGADAAAGVINIITKTAKHGTHGSAYSEFGSFSTKKYGAALSNKTDKYSIKIGADIVRSEGFTAYNEYGTDIDDYEDDSYKNRTLNGKFEYKLDDNNKFDLRHTVIDTEGEYDSPSGDADRTQKSKTKVSSLKLDHSNSFGKIELYLKNSDFRREYFTTSYSKYTGDIKEYGVKADIKYNKKDFVTVGVENTVFQTDEYYKSSLDKDYKNSAVFITNSNSFEGFIGGETIITESLRSDHYNAFENKVTGKLGIKHFHKNIKGFTTSFNYGTAYKVPAVSQLYGKPTYNPNIDPETIKSYDVTLEYKDLKVTRFHNEVDNMISYVNSTDGYENRAGKTTSKGYEVQYKTLLNDDTLLSLGGTIVSAKDKDGKKIRRIPEKTAKLVLDYYGIEKTHLGLIAEYIGERYDDDDEQGRQTGRYTLINTVANYDYSKNVKIYAKIDNITDKYYQTVDGYATSPRAYYAGVKVSF